MTPNQTPEVPGQPTPNQEGPAGPEVPKPKPEAGISSVTGILIALLAAVVVGAGVWAYYNYKVLPDLEQEVARWVTQNTIPKETADWKTYNNTNLVAGESYRCNYSFKYPNNWVILPMVSGPETDPSTFLNKWIIFENKENSGGRECDLEMMDRTSTNKMFGINLTLLQNSNNMSLEDSLKNYNPEVYNYNQKGQKVIKINNVSSLKITNIPARLVYAETIPLPDQKTSLILIPNTEHKFIIVFFYPSITVDTKEIFNEDQNSTIAELLINSFQFTK